jgi:hypothetical protein
MKVLAPLRAEDSRSEATARVRAEVFHADAVPVDHASRNETAGASFDATSSFSKGLVAKNPLGVQGVDAVQVSSHRGPPTDRPPHRPLDTVSVSGGSSTQDPVYQLASSLCLDHSLSGKSTPFAANAIYGVQKPSFCQASSQADSSHEFNWGLSWMPPRCGRLRRVSSLRYVPHSIQRCSSAQRDRVTCPPRVPDCTTRVTGPRALVGCSREPRWGAAK